MGLAALMSEREEFQRLTEAAEADQRMGERQLRAAEDVASAAAVARARCGGGAGGGGGA